MGQNTPRGNQFKLPKLYIYARKTISPNRARQQTDGQMDRVIPVYPP